MPRVFYSNGITWELTVIISIIIVTCVIEIRHSIIILLKGIVNSFTIDLCWEGFEALAWPLILGSSSKCSKFFHVPFFDFILIKLQKFYPRSDGRFIKIKHNFSRKKLEKTSNFLRGSFIIKTAIQFSHNWLEWQSQDLQLRFPWWQTH